MRWRELIRDVLEGYGRNDLLTYASAISFQLLFALVPLALFGLGVLGAVGLQDVYDREAVPALRDSVSGPMFSVVDDTVRRIFESKQVFWISAGAVIAVWETSGAVRAIMDVFDRIYGNGDQPERRAKLPRYVASILLAVVTGATVLGAVAVMVAGSITGGALAVARWPAAIVLLLLTMTLFVRFAPSRRRPWEWVSAGSALVVVAWLGTSVVFGLYVTEVADYGSLFGNLATVIILFEYLYLATCAFLTGAQVDALLRAQVEE